MPDHLHAVLHFTRGDGDKGARPGAPSLGRVIAWFKYQSTKTINAHRGTPREAVWQRGYHDRIIRDAAQLEAAREYVRSNPGRWMAKILTPGGPVW